MSKTIINTDSELPVTLAGAGSTVTVTASGSIFTPYYVQDFIGITIGGSADNSRVSVNGFIDVSASEGNGSAIECFGDNSSINIGKTGDIRGPRAIHLDAVGAKVTNLGRIAAEGTAIFCESDNAEISNSGTIFSGSGIFITGNGATVTNEVGGRMVAYAKKSSEVTFSLDAGEKGKFINHGMFDGNVYIPGSGNITIVNDGTIENTISLKDGNDTIDMRGGIYHGFNNEIYSGLGNDKLITDNAAYKLHETDVGGLDRVLSSVSYKLNTYVEILTLTGKGNINGTGINDNTYREYLNGNAGNNTLKGLGGNDVLEGGGGNDVLVGGGGLDLFWVKKGGGRDTINDFHRDEGDLVILSGFKNLGDVDKLNISEHKGDAWIDMGKGDIVILKGIDGSTLTDADFGW